MSASDSAIAMVATVTTVTTVTTVAPVEQRAAAIEAALLARGWPVAEAIDQGVHNADVVWLPERGAKVVGRAWTDPAFRQRLLTDGRQAVAEMGIEMPKHHRHLVALENTALVHNVICCTLCSCTARCALSTTPARPPRPTPSTPTAAPAAWPR